jgi:aconitate hydratase
MQKDFKECLDNKVGFKGFGLSAEKQKSESVMEYEGQNFTLKHGKLRWLRNLKISHCG